MEIGRGVGRWGIEIGIARYGFRYEIDPLTPRCNTSPAAIARAAIYAMQYRAVAINRVGTLGKT